MSQENETPGAAGTASEGKDSQAQGNHSFADVSEQGILAELQVRADAWNARVAKWRERAGDADIPEKHFKDHPAAEILRVQITMCELVLGAKVGEPATGTMFASVEDVIALAGKMLAQKTADLRQSRADHAAAMIRADISRNLRMARWHDLIVGLADFIIDMRRPEDHPLAVAFKTSEALE